MYSDREPLRRDSSEHRRRRSRSRSRSREREWDRDRGRSRWDHSRFRDLEHDRYRQYSREHLPEYDRDRLREIDERIRFERGRLREYDDLLRQLDRDRYQDLDRLRIHDLDRGRDLDRDRIRDIRSSGGLRHSRSRSRSRDRDGRRDRSSLDSKRPGVRPEMEITPVIMIRDVNHAVTRDHIADALGSSYANVKDIRCVHRQSGSKGFAMLEFKTATDATNWMEENRDIFKVMGETVSLEYCRQRKGGEIRSRGEQDWLCYKCESTNFFRRRVCLNCDTTRAESDAIKEDYETLRSGKKSEVDVVEESKVPPSNVLIFKGLDVKSDEMSVRRAVKDICAMPLKAVRLMKDKNTDVSRGFCFVELETIEDATELLQIIRAQYPAFFVDGRRVAVSFGRSLSSNTKASAAIAQAQWSLTSNAMKNVVPSNKDKASTGSDAAYPSTYSYDESSGFYYDSATGLYYDPKTQYHYNSETGLYCYYDASKLMYISVDKDGNPIDSSETSAKGSKPKKSSDVNTSKPQSAKQIAKDMERWSKKVNAAKSAQQQQLHAAIEQERSSVEQPVSSVPSTTSSKSLDPVSNLDYQRNEAPLSTVINLIEGQTGLNLQMGENEGPVLQPNPLPEDDSEGSIHIDWKHLACLLCKRKFTSKEMLLKHQQFSELHKANLAKEKDVGGGGTEPSEIKYRDRAKERREKFGTPAVIPGWKKRLERELVKEPIPYEEPTKGGITEENVGNRLLQAMGWSAGEGLGREKQGIVDPIQAERRVASAGLGATGSRLPNSSLYSSAGSYRETLKSLTKARYEETYKY